MNGAVSGHVYRWSRRGQRRLRQRYAGLAPRSMCLCTLACATLGVRATRMPWCSSSGTRHHFAPSYTTVTPATIHLSPHFAVSLKNSTTLTTSRSPISSTPCGLMYDRPACATGAVGALFARAWVYLACRGVLGRQASFASETSPMTSVVPPLCCPGCASVVDGILLTSSSSVV